MSMKGKPNTAQFKPPKDPTAFLEGGEADKAEKPLVAPGRDHATGRHAARCRGNAALRPRTGAKNLQLPRGTG